MVVIVVWETQRCPIVNNVCYDCLTVKSEWELIAGDDGVCLGESNIYHQLVDFSIMGGFESESRN